MIGLDLQYGSVCMFPVMSWWPAETSGDEAGRWLREFIRALFDYPDPNAAASGEVILTEREADEDQDHGA